MTEGPVLITGGAGFIGTNLTHRLASAGRPVTVFDSLARPGSAKNAQWLAARHHNLVTFEQAPISDLRRLTLAVARSSAVFHLAAQTAVTTSLTHPTDDHAVNTLGTLGLLETVRTHNPDAPVIFASTNKVYGHLGGVEIALDPAGGRYTSLPGYLNGIGEEQPLHFVSPYGCSKGAADQYVLDYAETYGLRTAVMRMSCVYGPHQNGTEDQGWVAHFMRAAMRGKLITIYGDGGQVRDLLHVADAVDAWLAVLANIEAVRGQAFNIGGGADNTASVGEVIKRIEVLCGAVRVEYGPWRKGDQKWYVSNTTKARLALGWRPLVGVEAGLQDLHTWLTRELAA